MKFQNFLLIRKETHMKNFRKIIIALFVIVTGLSGLMAQQFPNPVGFVNDFANVIPGQNERQIDAICKEVKQKTRIRTAILITKMKTQMMEWIK